MLVYEVGMSIYRYLYPDLAIDIYIYTKLLDIGI